MNPSNHCPSGPTRPPDPVLGQDSACHRRFRSEASECNLDSPGGALYSWSESSAVEPGEGQMGDVGSLCPPPTLTVRKTLRLGRMMEVTLLLASAIAFILLGFVGTRPTGKQQPTTQLGGLRIAAGLAMSFVGGAATITMSGLGHANGWAGLVDPLAVVAGGLIVVLFLTRSRMPESNQGIAGYFAGGNSFLRVIYTVATVFVYALLASAQIVATTKLVAPYLGETNSVVFAVLSFVCIVAYVHLGGIASVTRTDLAQFAVVVLLFVLPALAGLVMLQQSPVDGPPVPQTPLDTRTILLLSLSFLFVPLSQDVWVRARRARSVGHAKFGVFVGVVIYGVIVALAITVGVASARHGTALDDSETVLPVFFKQQLGVAGIVPTIFVLAAVLSTLDSFIFNLMSALSDDVLPLLKQERARGGRLAISALLIVSCLFVAMFAQSVLSLVLTALMIYVSVIGPGVLCRRFRSHAIALWLPAGITLATVLVLGLLEIRVPGEPYSFFFGHLALIVIMTGIVRATATRSNDGSTP